MHDDRATHVLTAWDWTEPVRAEDADGGLINHTWWVRGATGSVAVLQRLNTKIFRPVVHEDIEAVTAHLAARGLETPRLVRTRTGALWHDDEDGATYRCLTLVGDRTVAKLSDPADARSAGALVAKVHAALADLSWSFRMVRPGVHDTAVHFGRLREALETHRGHRLYAEVAELATEIFAGWSPGASPELPARIVHGDLKISNVRFRGPEAVAVIDLDTFQLSTLGVELGDAMRSWCNPETEDSPDVRFDLSLFEAAMEGYANGAGAAVTDDEWASVVPSIDRIASELASRFAWDALLEQYFGFDPKYGGRGEHNLARARGQIRLARSVRAQRDAAVRVVERARAAAR
ncbi:MAG: phosphotransferase [Myxococcota bacterium]